MMTAASASSTRAAAVYAGGSRPRWRGYTAFVLSGGGARGALQVGALRALLEHGERPDMIVGTSAGAWNGAMLARTPTPEGLDLLAAAWRTTNPAQVLLGREVSPTMRPQALAGLLLFAAARRVTSGNPSLYSDAGLRQLIAQHFGDHTFAELAVPLYVIATDLTRGRRAVFSSGSVVAAVLASSAIPGIFPPVQFEGNTYVDGGALDNYSLDLAVQVGARRLFVLDVGYDPSMESMALMIDPPEPHGLRPRRGRNASAHALAAVLERTSQAMSRYHLERALERLPRGIEVRVLSLSAENGGALQFGSAPEWIEHGYACAQRYLAAATPARVVTEGG